MGMSEERAEEGGSGERGRGWVRLGWWELYVAGGKMRLGFGPRREVGRPKVVWRGAGTSTAIIPRSRCSPPTPIHTAEPPRTRPAGSLPPSATLLMT